MTEEEAAPHNRKVQQILRKHGDVPLVQPVEGDTPDYVAALIADEFPHLGFSVFCTNGGRHGFFFHNLENLDLTDSGTAELMRFTHRGKAVTLRGQRLHEVFQAIMENRLQALYEHHAELYPKPAPDAPIIDRIQVHDLTVPRERREQSLLRDDPRRE